MSSACIFAYFIFHIIRVLITARPKLCEFFPLLQIDIFFLIASFALQKFTRHLSSYRTYFFYSIEEITSNRMSWIFSVSLGLKRILEYCICVLFLVLYFVFLHREYTAPLTVRQGTLKQGVKYFALSVWNSNCPLAISCIPNKFPRLS